VFEETINLVVTFWSADEEHATFAIGDGGAKDLGPSARMEESGLIDDEEIDADATEGIGIVSTVDDENGTGLQIDAHFGFIGALGPEGLGHLLEAIPGDEAGLLIVGGDVPDDAAWGLVGSAEHFHEGQMSFAEAAAGD
jgi:hypothetical protein